MFKQLDKQLHYLGCFNATLLLSFLVSDIEAALIVLTLGILKEVIWDYLLKKGTAEWLDIVADIAGILTAYVLLSWRFFV